MFRDGLKPVVRSHLSFAFDARNAASHASEPMPDKDAIGYLISIQSVAEAVAPKSGAQFTRLIDDQTKAMALALGVAPEVAAAKAVAPPEQANLDLGDGKYVWRPCATSRRRTPT